jgi:hypothetical protein
MRIYCQEKKANLLNIRVYTARQKSPVLKCGILNLYDVVLSGIQIPLVLQVYTASYSEVEPVLDWIADTNGNKTFFSCQYYERIYLPVLK